MSAALPSPTPPATPAPAHGKNSSHTTGEIPPPKPVISPPNTVALVNLVTGCKVFVERPAEPLPRKAEILSMRTKKLSRAARKATLDTDMDVDKPPADELLEYYVHYVEFNKVRRGGFGLGRSRAGADLGTCALSRSDWTNGSPERGSSSRAKSNGPSLPPLPLPPSTLPAPPTASTRPPRALPRPQRENPPLRQSRRPKSVLCFARQ